MASEYVEVNLDGRARKLRYDLRARRDFEKLHGKSILAVLVEWGRVSSGIAGSDMDRINQSYSYVTLSRLLWAGLKAFDKTMTEDKAIDLMERYEQDGNEITTLWAVIWEAAMADGVIPREMIEAGKKMQEEGEVENENTTANPQMEAKPETSPPSASTTG